MGGTPPTPIIIIMREKGTGIKSKGRRVKNQVMHNTVAHHLLINAQPVPEQQLAGPGHLLPIYILNMTFYGMEYPFG